MLNDSIIDSELHEQFGNLRIDRRIKQKWMLHGFFSSCGAREVEEQDLSE